MQRRSVRWSTSVAGALLVASLLVGCGSGSGSDGAGAKAQGDASASGGKAAGGGSPGKPGSGASTTSTTPLPPADTTVLSRRDRITGDISPKSVVASPAGHVTAQNMMYRHTVTAYDADGKLEATIPDAVDLEALGISGHSGTVQGAPVEAVFTHDGRYAYVSNYSMYGDGFGPEGSDACTPSSGVDNSFLYRIDTKTWKIDQAIEVGAVPKYVAITPDDETVLVTNWCSWDLSIVDAGKAAEVARVSLGRYPRGLAVVPDGSAVFAAIMGGNEILRVDLKARTASPFATVDRGPRHLVISPDGKTLYSTNNKAGTVTKVDAATGAVTARTSVGAEPRSMAISPDGRAVYVVSYESSTVSKLDAETLDVLDQEPTDYHPIGIAYEPTRGAVWVACYGGSILVFDDTKPA